ncbi:hypothetical protein NE634_20655, partial [Lacrimispora saccharolytica]|nr:hypothetical protein [Lacrimispora saccharolytica]
LNSNSESKGISYSKIQENGVIDLTKYERGTYYINFKEGEYAQASALTFKINGNQNIVLNIPDNTAKANRYEIEIDGKKYSIDGYTDENSKYEPCE